MSTPVTLDDVCSHIVDCEHKTAPIDDAGEHFAVGTPAMRGNQIDLSQARRIDEETFIAWTRRLRPKHGDLLFAREAPVGPIVRVPVEENVAPGQRTVLLRPDPSRADSRYLYYLLSSPRQQSRIGSAAAGSTVSHLNVADVRKFVLPSMPHLEEQRAIADVLAALDDKIAANAHLAYLARSLAEAEWRRVALQATESARLKDIASLSYGKALPATRRVAGDVPVVGSGGVTGSHDTALIDGPGVVIGRKGTVGAVYWLSGPHFPIDTAYFVTPTGHLSSHYLYYLLEHLPLAGMNSDSAVPGLNRNEAYAQPVRVPPLETLERFERVVPPLFDLIAGSEAESVSLAQTRDALLPLLMSGRVTVRDAEKVVEEAV